MATNKALASVAFVSLCLSLVACGWEGRKVRSEFVAGCVSQGASKDKCQCTFDQIEEHYGIDALIAMKGSGQFAPDFSVVAGKAVVACSS